MSELGPLIISAAQRLGIDPVDLATAISYETGGTFDPAKKGPTTKWGQHEGLIQMGEPQRKQYGYNSDGPLAGNMEAVTRYLQDRGVKPGMGMMDIYSTINAGAPGLYNRSDTAAGGAPGTVADKVNNQMWNHRKNALDLLGLGPQTGQVQTVPLPAIPGTEMAPGPQTIPVGMTLNSSPVAAAAPATPATPFETFQDQGFGAGMKALAGSDKAMTGLSNLLGGAEGEESKAPTIQPANIQSNSQAVAQSAQQLMAQLLASRGVRGLTLNGRG